MSPTGPNLTKLAGLGKGLKQQWGVNQGLEGQQIAQRNTESGSTIPGYQSLIDSGGYSPTEKAAIEQGATSGVQGAYGSAADQASRRMARTGNSAGYGSFVGNLARSKARDLGQTELQVQSQFADEALRRKMAGLQGLAQMYGVDTSFLSSLGQQQNQLLGIGSGAESRRRGLLGTIGSIEGLVSNAL